MKSWLKLAHWQKKLHSMKIRFSATADADIIESYLYGAERFGLERANRYEIDLRNALNIIADNPRLAAERSEFTPPVRIHHHAKHYIIYRIENDDLLILRLLRDESDLTQHLNNSIYTE